MGWLDETTSGELARGTDSPRRPARRCRKCGAVEQEREVMDTEHRWRKEGRRPAMVGLVRSFLMLKCRFMNGRGVNGFSIVSSSAPTQQQPSNPPSTVMANMQEEIS